MNYGLNGLNPLSYIGVNATQPSQTVVNRFPPTQNDWQNFVIGAIWIDRGTDSAPRQDAYMLMNLDGNIATWVQFISDGSAIDNWVTVSGTTQQMAINFGYITDNAGTTTLTLPAAAVIGSTVKVTGVGAGGWIIAQNAGQTIYFGNQNTTTGVAGSLASTNNRDSIELVCVALNTDWNVINVIGNITVT